MSANKNVPSFGIQELYLFPVYTTREAFKQATGVEAPPYDMSKPIKSWFDPEASRTPRWKLMYDRVIAFAPNGMPAVDGSGQPYTEPLILERDWAARVNIPPKSFDVKDHQGDQPTTGQEVPVPLRALEADEELYLQFGGTVAVRNKKAFAELMTSGGFLSEDRKLLKLIAEKLGIAA